MDEIFKKLDELEKRLVTVEDKLGLLQTAQSLPAEVPLPPVYRNESVTPSPGIETKEWWKGDVFAKAKETVGSVRREGLESYIGRWILGVVGILAIVFGASFFLKYAFENNLIPPAGRVALGFVGGTIFILLGEFIRSRYQKYSYILSGGGLALYYLSIYGAFHYYHLITQGTAFGFMSAITGFGIALSVWSGGIELAALAASFGFLTPYLLSTGKPDDFGFFGYLTVLNLGILAVAFFRKWQPLTLLGFVGTILNFSSWYGFYYSSEKLFFTLYILAIFYVLYTLAGVVANIATKKLSDSADLFIFSANAAWFFGWYYYLLHPKYDLWLGFIAAGLAAFYIVLVFISSSIHSEDKRLVLFLGAIAVVFLTIAIPLELEQKAITIAWAVEATVLFLLGIALRNEGMRFFAMGVLGISIFRLFFYDSGHGNLAEFIPVFNARFLAYTVTVAMTGVMAFFALRNSGDSTKQERFIPAILAVTINVLILIAITIEIVGFFDARIYTLNQKSVPRARQESPVTFRGVKSYHDYSEPPYEYSKISQNEYRSVLHQRNISISIFWTFYAIALITVGILYQVTLLRWLALILFGLTTAKVFFVDLAGVETIYRVVSSTILGVILLLASYLYFKYQKSLDSDLT